MKNILKLNLCKIAVILCVVFAFNSCDNKDEEVSSAKIIMSEGLKNFAIEAEGLDAIIDFTASTSWSLKCEDISSSKAAECTWVSFDKDSGIGGKVNLKMFIRANTTENQRDAIVSISCGKDIVKIEITQQGSSLKIMDASDVKDFERYYKPAEFVKMDMLRSDSKWSWFRSKQSEHFVVFWEAGFGDNPNSDEVPSNLRVDIDDLLRKAEQFFKTNIEKLKFAELGSGKSNLDNYKMQIYMLYQTEWLATGGGYDDVIGALWVNPSTCQPVGSTIAHEIGHSFQYQVYCDKILQGATHNFKHGFRYGYEGSNGGNGFWEQCAQWQSYQDYPEQIFANYHFNVWIANCHRHFSHEWMRYASYWLQYYWADKHGVDMLGEIWRNSYYPEDPFNTYMRLYCANNLNELYSELYDYAVKMSTFDINVVRNYSEGYLGKYNTKLYSGSDNYYQVAYASCPGTTGFNVISLNVPEAGTIVKTSFKGLTPGSALHPNDPGQYMESEVVKGTTTTYNSILPGNTGWRYGYAALKNDGTRVYSDMYTSSESDVEFTIPANTSKLYFVVMGAPTKYVTHPWDEKELNDEQWPYKVKFENTDLLGSVDIDDNADPKDISLEYNISFAANANSYDGTSVNLMDNGDIIKIAQAFVMQPTEISASFLSVKSNPAEGKIAFGAMETNGVINYETTANGYGFWFDGNGNVTVWGKDNDSKIFIEMDSGSFQFTIGQYPGKLSAGDKCTVEPVFVYVKNGKQYKAKIKFNITIK